MTYELKRRKAGGTWHYRFQVAGQRYQRSTRETNRGRAEAAALKAYQGVVERTNGGQPVPQLRALCLEWLDVNRQIISAHHARSVDTFSRLHLYNLADLAVNLISTTHIELARNEHLLTHKPASANAWLRIIKLVVNWAVKREIIARLPWKVAMLKVQKRPRAILPIDAAAAWFDAIDESTARTPGIGVAVRLMLFLGLRASEATSAQWDWIDWQRETYTPGKTKGREAEPLPMPKWLVQYLTPQRRDQGLIAAKPDGTPFPAGFARKAMISANLTCSTKGITPHRLRGTIATLLSEAGVPIQTIQQFLRHKSALTTMAYLEKNMAVAAKAQNEIAEKIGFEWCKSGARRESDPTECSMS